MRSPRLPGQGPLAIVVAVIVTLAIALAWLGLRLVRQDRARAEQQIRRDAQDAASRAAREIEAEIGRWRDAAGRVAGPASSALDELPQHLRSALSAPGGGVLLFAGAGGVRAWPRQQLLYLPDVAVVVDPAFAKLPPRLVEAENIEVRERNLPKAIAAYRLLLSASDPGDVREQLLLRLARTLVKAGRREEAEIVHDQLLREAGDSRSGAMAAHQRCVLLETAGSRPDLGGCAARFYEDLVASRWILDKPLYEFYAAEARTWLGPDAAGEPRVGSLDKTEQAKRRLTELARQAIEAIDARQQQAETGEFALGQRAEAVVFWSRRDDECVLALVSAARLISHAWPGVRGAAGTSFDFAVVPADEPLAGRGRAQSAVAAAVLATASLEASSPVVVDKRMLWQVRAWPRDAADRRHAATRRQVIYFAMLGLMLVSLVLAGGIAIRSVRHDVEVARLKAEFVSAVSHEFRSPLTAIRHLSEMLHTGRATDEERRKEYYGLIFAESRRLTRLVENLLDFARIEEGRQEFRMERLEATELVKQAVEEFKASGAASGRRIELAIAPDLKAAGAESGASKLEGGLGDRRGFGFILGDRQALTTIVSNLLDNAVKYSPDGRLIDVTVQRDGPQIVIAVADEGQGIAPEDLPHVFDRFYRGRDAAAQPGTGLGLALVRRLVAGHGGTIDVSSERDRGSTFTVRLPRAEEGRA